MLICGSHAICKIGKFDNNKFKINMMLLLSLALYLIIMNYCKDIGYGAKYIILSIVIIDVIISLLFNKNNNECTNTITKIDSDKKKINVDVDVDVSQTQNSIKMYELKSDELLVDEISTGEISTMIINNNEKIT